ncbi:GntR family transcriptional regulator [Xanthobacter sp. KR7-225]|uniref:GntR family transcriptional regulator n=1 Tax=Xanthobacter sp. KR7-225 TaxID=3156613 RepID=UPI0032B602FF
MTTTEKSTAPKTKRAADVVEKVYRQVRDMAIDYRFRPGERINEVELAQRFDVSRTPVRQALNRLEQEEFVTFVPNRGFFAREITPQDIRQIYEFRALVECGAFRLACERATDDAIRRIQRAWKEQTTRCHDWKMISEADENFHVAIADLAGNPHIVKSLKDLNAKIRFFRRIDLEDAKRRENTYLEHATILDRLRKRAVDGEETLRKHIVMSSAHAVEVTKEGLARIFFDTAA